MLNDTIKYYNKNAESFINGTRNVKFSDVQNKFLSYLTPNGYILDFGCGSGRDTKYFLAQGYDVEAWDGSETLCQAASAYTGIEVKHKMFSELSCINKYDGIWACASILHLPVDELGEVINKCANALKVNGIFYTSFKYGVFSGMRNGRYFTDMTENSFNDVLSRIHNLKVIEQWITSDVRPNRGDEQWLNLLLKKI